MQIEFSNNTIFLYGEFDYKITSSQLKKLSSLLAKKNTSLDLKGQISAIFMLYLTKND